MAKKSTSNLPVYALIAIFAIFAIGSMYMTASSLGWGSGDKSLVDTIKETINGEDVVDPSNDNVTMAVNKTTTLDTIPEEVVSTIPATTQDVDPETVPTSEDVATNEDKDLTTVSAPLTPTKTSFRVVSAYPLSNYYWGYDNTAKYLVLEGAQITTEQWVPNLPLTASYKTQDSTNSAGYTEYLKLENNAMCSWNDVNGKVRVVLESPSVVSSTGAVEYIVDAPTKSNQIIVLPVVPTTYGFSTIIEPVDGDTNLLSWLTDSQSSDSGNFDTSDDRKLKITDMKPTVMSSTSWNLANFLTYSPQVDIYLSTDGKTWKKSTFVSKNAYSADTNQLHVDLYPQILGSSFVQTSGQRTFYVKFDLDNMYDEYYKVSYQVYPAGISNIKFTEVDL